MAFDTASPVANGNANHTSHVNGMTNGHVDSSDSSTDGSTTRRPAHKRKNSSPLAPPFMVSSPGKCIVYGEHAVVYQRAAMAASISLRSYLLVTALSKSRRTITMNFPDISLFGVSWSISDLPWELFTHASHKKRYFDRVTALDTKLVDALQPHIEGISPDMPAAQRKIHQAAALCFLYLFMSLGSPTGPGCIYTLRSTIPVGQGLGSSASVSVCMATAFLIQSRALSGPHPDQMEEEAEKQLERINHWAFVGEMCIHGNPSGVDNTVATRGRAVIFQRTDYNKPPIVTNLKQFPELPLLLVDTCVPKSTAAEVAKVAVLKKTHPVVTDHILNAIDSITQSAHELISRPDFSPQDPANITRLGELMTLNHGLLCSLGVSHPKLERLSELVKQSDVGWTKLTGAGGGGCAITLLKPEINAQEDGQVISKPSDTRAGALQALEADLAKEGFQKYETTLGGDGVGVLWPAVLHNGSDEDGGEEIDQEKFMAAEGREGVERLVGVIGGGQGGTRDGWKFWRP